MRPLGHYFQLTLHKARSGVRWADEFFATYFAFCYLQTKGLFLLPSASTGLLPTYRSLADFERLYHGVGGANYGWYQDQFVHLANSLYPRFKTKLVQRVVEEYGPLGEKKPPMELFPQELKAWLESLQR